MTSRLGKTTADRGAVPQTRFRRRLDSLSRWTIRGFMALWLVTAAGVIAAFMATPRDDLRAADWQLDGGAVESFDIGHPKMIQGGPQPVWVARLDPERFTAFAAVCKHQHCVLRWNPVLRVFSCPCHHGTYDLEGRFVAGPSGAPLPSFFVNIKGGRVRVHLRRTIEDTV